MSWTLDARLASLRLFSQVPSDRLDIVLSRSLLMVASFAMWPLRYSPSHKKRMRADSKGLSRRGLSSINCLSYITDLTVLSATFLRIRQYRQASSLAMVAIVLDFISGMNEERGQGLAEIHNFS